MNGTRADEISNWVDLTRFDENENQTKVCGLVHTRVNISCYYKKAKCSFPGCAKNNQTCLYLFQTRALPCSIQSWIRNDVCINIFFNIWVSMHYLSGYLDSFSF